MQRQKDKEKKIAKQDVKVAASKSKVIRIKELYEANKRTREEAFGYGYGAVTEMLEIILG